MNWIDINEKHPEFNVVVLVTGEGRVAVARLISKTITADSVSLRFADGEYSNEDLWITVKYWAEIPEIPT